MTTQKKRRDHLRVLEVIDRLEVGPVELERNRLAVPYRIVTGKKTESMEFVYRYEENVFEPEDSASLNLASMMAAQVALNYGLFCKEIIFHGLYDTTDRKFIVDMMENTSREIYVKKLLEDNPFLLAPVDDLPAVKLDSYTRARIGFTEAVSSIRSPDRSWGRELPPWNTESSRSAVLSSGGKDSLLSFGLLKEMGCEVHPVFVNESGRHWYTALNAYRYCSRTYPETSRVWTNCDRMFTWMLRHIPFIRQDFANVRADEYPIRLWTVAVFIFGALPILRKRRVGRVVIGDEYDTTRRLKHRGITHYDGLFDQSRYFDNVLSRYYARKRWGMVQLSIIRSLAELLIEKILVERYPDLQSHQVSCHAAHIDGERVHPCGKCEKCRRIVGMLLAFDADPTRCGYTSQQIETCLADLSVKRVHQEAAGAEHLMYLLQQRGLVPEVVGSSLRARERPEILNVRVDPERSPPDELPEDIRAALYRIFLEHAQGAVMREGRSWTTIDLLKNRSILKQGRVMPKQQKKDTNTLPGQGPAGSPKPYLLGELNWPRAQERFKEVDLAILPIGSIEQHGPHLPLDTDTFDAEYLAEQIAIRCSDPKPLVLPVIPYGVSYHHDDFSGTISVSPDTLSHLVHEVGISCARHGIKKLVIINSHGGNIPALQFASQMINRDAHIFTCVESGETSDTDIHSMTETPNDVHAGEIETSTSLATRPELVDLDRARKHVPRFSSRYLDFSSKRSVEWYARTQKISKSGVLGDPTKASREKGEQIWETMISHLLQFVEDLKGMTLDEIYHRRF